MNDERRAAILKLAAEKRAGEKEASLAAAGKVVGKAVDWAARVGGRGTMKARNLQKLQKGSARAGARGDAKIKGTYDRMAKRTAGTATENYGGPAAAAKIRKARLQAAGGAGLLATGAAVG